MLNGASSLLYGCHSPVGGRICSLVVGLEAPISVCELWFEVGRIGALPLREKPLSIPLMELSTGECALWCHLSPVSQSTLLLALPSDLPQLWECQKSALLSLRCCFHKTISADP